VIGPQIGSLPPATADYLSALDFKPGDHARYEGLSAKAARGDLSPDESSELDKYLHVDALISILRFKATRSKAEQISCRTPPTKLPFEVN